MDDLFGPPVDTESTERWVLALTSHMDGSDERWEWGELEDEALRIDHEAAKQPR